MERGLSEGGMVCDSAILTGFCHQKIRNINGVLKWGPLEKSFFFDPSETLKKIGHLDRLMYFTLLG